MLGNVACIIHKLVWQHLKDSVSLCAAIMYFLSLSPRPKTNPSTDRFQYPARYTGSDIRAG